LLVMFGHVGATRVGPLLVHTSADFSFLTFSLETSPWIFYPYYFLLVLSGLFHMTNGALLALRVLGAPLPSSTTAPRSPAFWAFTSLAGAACVASVLALGGRFFEVDRKRYTEFRALYDRFVPAFARPWSSERS